MNRIRELLRQPERGGDRLGGGQTGDRHLLECQLDCVAQLALDSQHERQTRAPQNEPGGSPCSLDQLVQSIAVGEGLLGQATCKRVSVCQHEQADRHGVEVTVAQLRHRCTADAALACAPWRRDDSMHPILQLSHQLLDIGPATDHLLSCERLLRGKESRAANPMHMSSLPYL